MTVSDLIKALQEMPQDAPVEVDGYEPTRDADETYHPTHVEALKDGDGRVSVVVWAMIDGYDLATGKRYAEQRRL